MDVGLNGVPAYLIGISTHLILVYALFRQWFRFSTQATLLGAAALKIMELCADEFMTDETRWVLAILAALQIPLLIPLMKKGMRRLMLIIYMIYAFIYNAFGGIVISAMTIGCRIRNLYYWAGAFNYAGIGAAANSAAARKSQAANTDAGTIRVLSKGTRNTAPAA